MHEVYGSAVGELAASIAVSLPRLRLPQRRMSSARKTTTAGRCTELPSTQVLVPVLQGAEAAMRAAVAAARHVDVLLTKFENQRDASNATVTTQQLARAIEESKNAACDALAHLAQMDAYVEQFEQSLDNRVTLLSVETPSVANSETGGLSQLPDRAFWFPFLAAEYERVFKTAYNSDPAGTSEAVASEKRHSDTGHMARATTIKGQSKRSLAETPLLPV